MQFKLVAPAVVVLSVLAAASSQAPTRTPAPGARCYSLTLGRWTPTVEMGEDTIFMVPPRRFRVDSTPDPDLRARAGSRAYLVRALDAPPIHTHGSWQWVRPDSVELLFSDGYSGLALTLYVRGDSLVGTAETFWDFPRTRQSARAMVREISCESWRKR